MTIIRDMRKANWQHLGKKVLKCITDQGIEPLLK